jgi:hypothetical protein
MEKKYIDTFIKKYYLGGSIEKIRWTSDSTKLLGVAMTSDRNLFVSTESEKGSFFNGVEVGIQDTSRLKGMLNVLSENITINADIDQNDATRVRWLNLNDDNTTLVYVTADVGVIDPIPKMKTIPTFDVEIDLTDEFVATYLKAKSALPEADLFTLVMSKKKQKMEMVLGYKENVNSDRIIMTVPTQTGKDTVKKPISFNAKHFKEIIAANNECKAPKKLLVSEAGLASLQFEEDGFKSLYYLIKIDVED